MQNYCFSVVIKPSQYAEIVRLAKQYGYKYPNAFNSDNSKPSADFIKSRDGVCYLEFDSVTYSRTVPFDLLEGLLILLSLGMNSKLAFNSMGLEY